ncbi:hypothetical protein [Granulicatella seriolae]|uniref:Uncharacterized protein n=1 Tax=Granulicatella seriolae TaxID=2967226 RepID=A0ABT1WLL5_9LACT|nr:hypothetical protein [Granulicatella seriolae]
MNANIDNYIEILRMSSKDLIKQDGLLLIDLSLNVKDSAIALSLIPFYALYCRSAKEFLDIDSKNKEIEKEITDIRNGLKIFTGKFSKGRKMSYHSDDQQNELFKNELRFSFTKKLNIHFNLGVYFDKQGKVIFNTQLAHFYLNISKNKGKSIKEHSTIVGQIFGEEIGGILVNHCDTKNLKDKMFNYNPVPKYGYIDFNTNRKQDFFNNQLDKETNLIYLHMVSAIGFVNNLLVPILQDRNTWLLRIMYITAHNTLLGIKKSRQNLKQNSSKDLTLPDIEEYLKEDMNVFSTSFRNCMMHYDLVDKEDYPVILQSLYNPEKPLYGLIESCFDGMNFNQYFDKLYKTSQKLENYLLSYFTINYSKICWNWD